MRAHLHLLVVCGVLCPTPLAQDAASDAIAAKRAEAALERALKARARVEVASMRIEAELSSVGLSTRPPSLTSGTPVEESEAQTLAEISERTWALVEQLQDVSLAIEESFTDFGSATYSAGHISSLESIPYVDLQARRPTGEDAAEWVSYIEHGAFLCEQAAQVSETISDRAITFGDLVRDGDTALALRAVGWRELGPGVVRMGEGYDGSPVDVSGRATSVAFNSNSLFAGTARGGIWELVDDATWYPATPSHLCSPIGAVAVDASNPNVIYGGIGDASVSLLRYAASNDRARIPMSAGGVLVSRDAGETWMKHGSAIFENSAFDKIVTDRAWPGVVLSATTRGLAVSFNYGKTWQMVPGLPSGEVTDIAVCCADQRILAGIYGRGIYSCRDIWAPQPEWVEETDGLPLSNVGNIKLATAGSADQAVYALIATADHKLRGLYWRASTSQSWDAIRGMPDLLNGHGFFSLAIAGDPRSAARVLIGGTGKRGIDESSLVDARFVEGRWTFNYIGEGVHIDIHSISFDTAEVERIVLGSDGGVWESKDNGQTWRNLNGGLATLQCYSIARDPLNPERIFSGTQDNGTVARSSGGGWLQVDQGDGGTVLLDPKNPNRVYNVFSDYRIALSEAGGARSTFRPVYPTAPGQASAFLAPAVLLAKPESSRLVLGLAKLWVSDAFGRSWRPISDRLTPANHYISALAPFTESGLLIGTTEGTVYLIRDMVDPGSIEAISKCGEGQDAAFITALHSDGDRILVASDSPERGLIEVRPASTGSSRWTEDVLLSQCPVYALEITADAVIAGTNEGARFKLKHEPDWLRLGQGLPVVPVFDLEYLDDRHTLTIATFGRGVWELSHPLL